MLKQLHYCKTSSSASAAAIYITFTVGIPQPSFPLLQFPSLFVILPAANPHSLFHQLHVFPQITPEIPLENARAGRRFVNSAAVCVVDSR